MCHEQISLPFTCADTDTTIMNDKNIMQNPFLIVISKMP